MTAATVDGALLRQWREYKGWKRAEVARRLRVSWSAVHQWETGKTRPSLSNLEALAEQYSASLDEFVQGVPAAPAKSVDRSRERRR